MARVIPDKALVKDQLQALQAMLRAWGTTVFLGAMFWVLAKKPTDIFGNELQPGKAGDEPPTLLVPFILNRIQRHLLDELALNNLLLKARQIGGTTFFLLVRGLLNSLTNEGCNSLLVSQSSEFAETHFLIANRAYRMFGIRDPRDDRANEVSRELHQHLLHTKFINRRELYFDQIESRMAVASAEVEESGQGITLHHIVASEYSRWPKKPEATLANIRGALVPGGTLDIECTANGAAGSFFEKFSLAMNHPQESDAKAHFYPWWWADEYALEVEPDNRREMMDDLREDERKLIDAFHLDLNQIAWRREAKKQFPGIEFDEKFPWSWTTAFVVSGNSYFDRDILVARKMELQNYRPHKSFSNGAARIFKPRAPGRRYIIGADPATGRAVTERDTDFCAAVVLDVETGEECAAYRAKVTPQEFAYDLADLGVYFNSCPILVERTGDGGSVILVLAGECRYPAIMKTKEWLKRQRDMVVEFDGFPTNVRTRPIALNFVNRHLKEYPHLVWDVLFIDEALVFVRDEAGKPAATVGAHDDTVAARWIAHAGRQIILGYWPLEGSEKYITADRLPDAPAVV